MLVGSSYLYIVLARYSSYFRVWQEIVDCVIAVQGLSFQLNMAGPSKKMHVSDEEMFYELLTGE
jgi:hypothetical protein